MTTPSITRAIGATLGLALAAGANIALAASAQADPNPNITICHATGNPDHWVVLTVDAAAITSQGHDQHQDGRDVVPPFEYVAENSGETVSFAGQNWAGNWATNGEGVATETVDESMCAAPDDEPTPPTDDETTPSEGEETTPPTGEETTPPTGEETTPPVVQTDGVTPEGPDLGLVAGGAGLLLAGGATLVLANRRRSQH